MPNPRVEITEAEREYLMSTEEAIAYVGRDKPFTDPVATISYLIHRLGFPRSVKRGWYDRKEVEAWYRFRTKPARCYSVNDIAKKLEISVAHACKLAKASGAKPVARVGNRNFFHTSVIKKIIELRETRVRGVRVTDIAKACGTSHQSIRGYIHSGRLQMSSRGRVDAGSAKEFIDWYTSRTRNERISESIRFARQNQARPGCASESA
jgi:hypothetical protein